MPEFEGRGSKVIVAIDGFDGSGKTTVAQALYSELSTRGVSCRLLGRRIETSSVSVDSLTTMLLLSDGRIDRLDPRTDAHIRLARLFQRTRIAWDADDTVIIFDRWIPSDLSRLKTDLVEEYLPQFVSAHQQARVDLTIRLDSDFRTAWNRLSRRRALDMSPSERLGRDHNAKLHERLAAVWDSIWREDRLDIDASGSKSFVVSSALSAISGKLVEKGLCEPSWLEANPQ